jgi:glyoxylase-like metal-dependent hydrolase (beta-lactamase superfamily II)
MKKTSAAIAAAVALVVTAPARSDTPQPPQAQSVAARVWLIPGGFLPNRQPDGNTVIFAAPKGLIVMDTGRHLWHRQAILDFTKSRHSNIAAIVNSHWHLDHVSGNPDLKRAYPDAIVYASNAIDEALTGFLAKSAADARSYLATNKVPPETEEDIRGDLATFESGNLLRPDVVVSASGKKKIAGKTLDVNLAPNAATAGDVWLYDPSTRVAAVGDLVTLPVPFLDTACPVGWSAALAQIWATPFKIAIPGHGAPMTRDDFATYRKAFNDFIACAASNRAADECVSGWLNDAARFLGKDDAALKRAKGLAAYYVSGVLRKNGGKSAECKA